MGSIARLTSACALLALACSSSPASPPRSAQDRSHPSESGPTVSRLTRQQVVSTVDGGFGYFLQKVRVEPELKDGKFEGFRVLELIPPSYWRGIDLKPGDVVTQINGASIESPNSAFEVFQSLKQAPELRVVYLREGATHQLILPIIGAPAAPEAPAKT